MKIHIKGMDQIGDSLYSRPFVRVLLERGDDVYISTSNPNLYTYIDGIHERIKFVRPVEIKLRTPQVEFLSANVKFHELPSDIEREIDFHYNGTDLKSHGIFGSIEKRFGFTPGSSIDLVFDMPCLINHRIKTQPGKKIAIIRPVTLRKEFLCETRSPEPNYVNWIARILKDQGYFTISMADLVDGQEWLVADAPVADMTLHKGELGILGTLSLMASADLLVGGSGFVVPAAIMSRVPLFVVFGGRGEYDNPQKLFDLRMNLKKVGWAMPDNFCRCNKNVHDCDKKISDLDHQFFSFMKTL